LNQVCGHIPAPLKAFKTKWPYSHRETAICKTATYTAIETINDLQRGIGSRHHQKSLLKQSFSDSLTTNIYRLITYCSSHLQHKN